MAVAAGAIRALDDVLDGAPIAFAGEAKFAGIHEASGAHAFDARRRGTVFAGSHEPPALDHGALFAPAIQANVAGVHEAVSAAHAFVASHCATFVAESHAPLAVVGAAFALGCMTVIAGGHARTLVAVFAFRDVAAIAGDDVSAKLKAAVANGSGTQPFADKRVGVLATVVAPEPPARIAGQHVLRILRTELHTAVVCASLAHHERRANVALGDVELAAADERLQAADRLLVERVDAVHRVAQRLERDARELPAAHIQHG